MRLTRRRAEPFLLVLAALIAATFPVWPSTVFFWVMAAVSFVVFLGLVVALVILYVGFRRWERDLDKLSRKAGFYGWRRRRDSGVLRIVRR